MVTRAQAEFEQKVEETALYQEARAREFALDMAEEQAQEDRFINRAAIISIGAIAFAGAVTWGVAELGLVGDDSLSAGFTAMVTLVVGVLVGRFSKGG